MNKNPGGSFIISRSEETGPAPKSDSAEAKHFEELAAKLVQVPKNEIDAKRQPA
jgi:hypothetical protein